MKRSATTPSVLAAALALLACACGGGRLTPRTDASWTPAPACALAFDPGTCRAVEPVYAFVNGACGSATYGGCGGNDNRFSTLEECLITCEGRPDPNGCPAGRIVQTVCLACGAVGGCALSAPACALQCNPGSDLVCPDSLSCTGGVCQVAGCI